MHTPLRTHIALAGLAATALTGSVSAAQVEVTVTNIGPNNGVAITPLWVGFHDGSFDSYNGGLSTQEGLERLAEDGNTSAISADFLAGRTYVQDGVSGVFEGAQTTDRVDGTLASMPIAPGASASEVFDIAIDGTNRFFSYASMILPSNDYFIANGNPEARDLQELYNAAPGTQITFFIGGTVNDAGTEVNDFSTSAGNALFPQLGLGDGQGGPDIGADEDDVVRNVVGIPFGGFLNSPSNLDTNAAAAQIDFNRGDLYPNGIAQITFTVVPEPNSLALLGLGSLALIRRRR